MKTLRLLLVPLLFVIAACSSSGDSGSTSQPGTDTHASPSGVTVTASDSQAQVSWTAVEGAAYYNIYWSQQSPVTSSASRVANITETSYTFDSLVNDQTYYFAVSAVFSDGVESAVSSTASGTPMIKIPDAPSSVSISAEQGAITLSWSESLGATSYNVYWSQTSPVSIADASRMTKITSTSTTHAGLVDGQAYYYVVTAVNSSGESAVSSQVGANSKALGAGAPATVSMTVSGGAIAISWEGVEGVSSYNLYWNNAGGVETTDNRLVVGDATSYAATGLTSGQIYYYAVTSVSGSVESATSLEVSVIP